MSKQRNDGGPAFPLNPDTNVSHKGDIYEDVMGISKLDWFAGQALAGMLASGMYENNWSERELTAHAYTFGRYMLAARSQDDV